MIILYLLVLATLVIVGNLRTTQFRKTACEKLSGKWGKSVCIVLAYMLVLFLLNLIPSFFDEESALTILLSLAVSILGVPLSYGLTVSFFKLYNGEEVKAFDFLSSSFSNFGRAWAISLRIFLKLLVPIILYIIAISCLTGSIVFTAASTINDSSFAGPMILSLLGFVLLIVSAIWLVIRSFTYEMAGYIAIDSPELSTKQAVNHSKEIMIGNRAKFFWLGLSFGGWIILASIPLGIGFLWLAPYMQIANIAFYYFVAGKTENNTPVEESTNTIEPSSEG